MTLAQRKVQASYYRRLALEGHALDDLKPARNGTFVDTGEQRRIDHGIGRHALKATSYEVTHALEIAGTVWDTPEAAWWRLVTHETHALPRTYPRRRFLVAWAASGDVLNSARTCKLSRQAGRYAVRKFLRRLWAAGKLERLRVS